MNSGGGKKQYDHLIKLIIIGDSSVGKSCILLRFSEDHFPTSHMPTIGKSDTLPHTPHPNAANHPLRHIISKPLSILLASCVSYEENAPTTFMCATVITNHFYLFAGIDFKIKTINVQD